MDNVRETAFGLTAWYAFLVILGAVIFIITSDLDPPSALLAAANVALLFAFVMIVQASGLTEHSIIRGQFWQALPMQDRPRGERGRRMVSMTLKRTLLQFARGAAAVAIVLCTTAYMMHKSTAQAGADAERTYVSQPAD